MKNIFEYNPSEHLFKIYLDIEETIFTLIDEKSFDLIEPYNWSTVGKGYACSWFKKSGDTLYLHRFLLNCDSEFDTIDHINNDKLDNRLCNLRFITRQGNNARNGPQKNNTSGYKGVCWHNQRGKWMTSVKYNGKNKYFGIYKTKEEAALAYNVAAKQLFGQYAYQNVISSTNT